MQITLDDSLVILLENRIVEVRCSSMEAIEVTKSRKMSLGVMCRYLEGEAEAGSCLERRLGAEDRSWLLERDK
jgi:hypothetical protein